MSAELSRHHARDLFSEDVAPLTVLSARAPRVQPPPTGPREECLSEKFRSRYCKSEVFGQDRGRRHFQASSDSSPPRGGASSPPRAGSVVARSGANSPREGSVVERTSPRDTPAKPMDLFTAPPGTWTPLKRNTSRAASPSGYISPSIGSHYDQAPAFDLVTEAAHLLRNSSPSRAGSVPLPGSSGRRSPATPGVRPGLPNRNYLPPARQTFPDPPAQAPPAPSQQRSFSVGEVLQPKICDSYPLNEKPRTIRRTTHASPETTKLIRAEFERPNSIASLSGGDQLQPSFSQSHPTEKPRLIRRGDSNASVETGNLIRAEFERANSISFLPGSSEFRNQLRGRGSSPRRISSTEVPWALDDNANGGNLADLARNCLQQKMLQSEVDGRVGLRSNAKAQSLRKTINVPATRIQSRGAGGLEVAQEDSVGLRSGPSVRREVSNGRSEMARGDISEHSRGGRSEKSRGTPMYTSPTRKDQESSLIGPAALVNFVAEVSNENKCSNKVQPIPKLCEVGRLSWQEPVKSNKIFR
mmetsp:Transcript_109595/g.173119  ORF Transcript_109595/g.173119 Transcript_109595/m.173119 type:complete len:528 (-) Transcript_109595:247-1830(-)